MEKSCNCSLFFYKYTVCAHFFPIQHILQKAYGKAFIHFSIRHVEVGEKTDHKKTFKKYMKYIQDV